MTNQQQATDSSQQTVVDKTVVFGDWAAGRRLSYCRLAGEHGSDGGAMADLRAGARAGDGGAIEEVEA